MNFPVACKRCGCTEEFAELGTVEASRGVAITLGPDGSLHLEADSHIELDKHSFKQEDGYECARCGDQSLDPNELVEYVGPRDRFGRPVDDRGIAHGPPAVAQAQEKLPLCEEEASAV